MNYINNRVFRKKEGEALPLKVVIAFIVILIVIIIIAIVLILVYSYLSTPEKKIGLGASISDFKLSEDEKTAYIRLLGGTDNKQITKIRFIFKDESEGEYVYETTKGIENISVDFERTFLDWLFAKPVFDGSYDYRLSSSEINLSSFSGIREVSVFFEYAQEGGTDLTTPSLDTYVPPVNQTKINCTDRIKNGDEVGIDCGGSCKACSSGSGPSGPGPSGPGCSADKACSYYYNLNQCGNGLNDGCTNSLNCQDCNDGFYCWTGEGINNLCLNDSISCVDSDGKDYFNKGNVTISGKFEDFCDTSLIEYYCYYNGTDFEAKNESVECQKGCLNGRCNNGSTISTPSFSTSVTSPIAHGDASNYNAIENNENDGGCTYTLMRDDLFIATGSFISDSSILPIGTYIYNYSTSGCENYTQGSSVNTLVVNQAIPIGVITGTGTYIPSTTTTVAGTENNDGDSDCIYQLFRDGDAVSNPDVQTLAIGAYSYVYSTAGCINYSSATLDTKTLIINVCTPICTGKQCGIDECGNAWGCGPETAACTQSFGTCTASGTKTCSGASYGTCSAVDPRISNCAGKVCGSDGCGGICGPETLSCTQTFGTCTVSGTRACTGTSYGTCSAVDPRTANCAGKQCGGDNCGGTCGTCAPGDNCNAAGQCIVKEKKFISYWRFDGNANDDTGNNNGTVYGATLTQGISGQAYSFDGINDYINVGTLGTFGAANGVTQMQNGVSVSIWVKYLSATEMSIFGNYNSGPSQFYLRLNSNIYGGSVEDRVVFYWNQVNNHGGYYDFIANINDGNWHNIIVSTIPGTTQKAWVDGVPMSIGSYSNGPASIYDSWQISSYGLAIGAHMDAGTTRLFYNGVLDEVKIWNYTLSDQEVLQEYNSFSGGLSNLNPSQSLWERIISFFKNILVP